MKDWKIVLWDAAAASLIYSAVKQNLPGVLSKSDPAWLEIDICMPWLQEPLQSMVRLSTRLIMTHNYCMPPIYAASLNTTAEGYF